MSTDVSKAIIQIAGEIGLHYLMSSKRKPGHRDHNRLEFLGGRHDPGEDAKTALIRELAEEEATGMLSGFAEQRLGESFEIIDDERHHYLYQFRLVESEYEQLVADSGESMGFSLVPAAQLYPGELFTFRTNQILSRLAESDPMRLLSAPRFLGSG